MSISHLSLVNQKLAFASALLTNLNPVTTALTTTQKLQQKALTDAVVFHLITALHFYTRELAELQRVKNLSAINSVRDLVIALEQMEGASSEVSELLALTQTDNAWLSQLTGYYRQLFQSPEKPKERKSFGQENLIEFVELTEAEGQTPLQLTPELLVSWLDSFRALVARQRETNAEY